MVQAHKIYLVSILMLSGCGGLDRVETIKGPPGPPGPAGIDGRAGVDGRDGSSLPLPKPEPQEPKVDGRNGQGTNSNSVIIYNGPSCTSGDCAILVCACVDKAWRTIMISRDQISNYKIKNVGRCSAGYDDVFKEPAYCRSPMPQPAPQPKPEPKPTPTPKEDEC
jgi:hypothetical protein